MKCKRYLILLCLLISTTLYAQVESVLPALPSPAHLYNDLTKSASFLTKAQADYLERVLVSFDDSTSNQIALVVVESLGGYTANEYATALGRKWEVGSQAFNNGVVVLISTGGEDGNRDAYIAVGYGLEGAIPDVTADAILENELIPFFKEGNYFEGFKRTVDALKKAAAGEYKQPRRKRNSPEVGIPSIIFVIILILISLLASRGGGGTMINRRGHRGWTGGTWMGGGWGGGSSWGGSGGGGFGGGFGGFGGGSFGGGGAGGKW
jgi:uncharacterized protein